MGGLKDMVFLVPRPCVSSLPHAVSHPGLFTFSLCQPSLALKV